MRALLLRLAVPFLVPWAIGILSVHAQAQSSLRTAPPPASEVRKAIEALPAQEQPPIKAAAAAVSPVFVILPGVLGSKLTKVISGNKTVVWGEMGGSSLLGRINEH